MHIFLKPRFLKLLLVLLFIVLSTLGITYFLARNNQDIRSRAGNSEEKVKKDKSPPVVLNEIIVKLRNTAVSKNNLGFAGLDTGEVEFTPNMERSTPRIFRELNKNFKVKSLELVFKPAKKKVRKNVKPPISAPIYLVKFKKDVSLISVSQFLQSFQDVEYAEFNSILKAVAYPDDPFYKDQKPAATERNQAVGSGGWNPPFDYQWGLKKINMEPVWEETKGDSNLLIAVIDTGVDQNHADLAGKVISGYNFVSSNNNTMDDNAHGTHVSGIIAALTNNNIGVAGVNPQSKILAIKGLDNNGSGSVTSLAASIDYARINGVRVINASWGAMGESPTLKLAVDQAVNSGVVFVAAAGNDGADSRNFIPAKYRNVIAVGASDTDDRITNFSNIIGLDLVAPGGNSTTDTVNFRNILSLKTSSPNANNPNLTIGTQYLRLAGTSMAAPFVAGAVSMLLSSNPTFSPEQVRSLFRTTAYKENNETWTKERGYGRLDVGNAFSLKDSVNVARILSPDGVAFPEPDINPITFMVSGPYVESWILDYGTGLSPSSWTNISQGQNTSPNLSANLSVKSLAPSIYTMRLRVTSSQPSLYPDIEDRLIISRTLDENWRATLPPGDFSFISGPTIVRLDDSLSTYSILAASQTGMQIYDTKGIRVKTIPLPAGEGNVTNLSYPSVGKLLPNVAGNQIVVPNFNSANQHIILHLYDKNGEEFKNQNWPIDLGFYNLTLPRPSAITLSEVASDGKLYIVTSFGDMLRIFDGEGNTLNQNWPKQMQANGNNIVYANRFFNTSGNELQILSVDNTGQVYIFDLNGQRLSEFVLPISGNDYSVVFTDLNDDGFKEIITKYSLGREIYSDNQQVVAYTRFGQILWSKTIGPVGFNYGYSLPIVSDVNGDSKNEIVVVDEMQMNVFDQQGNIIDNWSQTKVGNILNMAAADLGNDKISDIYFDVSVPTQIGSVSKGVYQYIFPFPGQVMVDAPGIADFRDDGHASLIINAPFGSPMISYALGPTEKLYPELTWPQYFHDTWRSNSDGVCVKNGCDLNRDGQSNSGDVGFLKSCFGKGPLLSNCKPVDLDCDNYVTILDFSKYALQCPQDQ